MFACVFVCVCVSVCVLLCRAVGKVPFELGAATESNRRGQQVRNLGEFKFYVHSPHCHSHPEPSPSPSQSLSSPLTFLGAPRFAQHTLKEVSKSAYHRLGQAEYEQQPGTNG